MSREDFIAKRVKEGASESTLREVFNLADRIHSVADLKALLGEADRIDTWSDELSERADELRNKTGLPHDKWERCHVYYERWKPAYLTVFEFEGGLVSWSVAVCPTPAKDSPGVPHKR